MSKHQGFELGVRIPTINDPYFKVVMAKDADKGEVKKGDSITINLRRDVAAYINYVVSF
ncbi:outer membrane beta-barrel protein [Helicobacter baculiformis]|uniref:Outer membrane beta-barrel protein n=1 Tax=Helicobacter baculiformis TaxID=427351 RepID=A0ABV7ZJ10_9HELI|nr:outer membrane beta-barrel protein [Helicobacter baculiformis]